jgi:hypothetical protein
VDPRTRLRLVADTRPGYATYPDTPPGSPRWPRQPEPCTWALREGAGLVCLRADHQHCAPTGSVVLTAVAAPDPQPTGFITTAVPPARRWWHRLTNWRTR